MRLIDRLRELGLSQNKAKQALMGAKVYVGGVPTALATREVEGPEVELRPHAPRLRVGQDVVLLHRGSDYAVIWKPPGLLSTPAPGRRNEVDLLARCTKIVGRPALAVHRLDEDTSGLMLVAFRAKAQQDLKDRLARREITRRYLALVSPRVPPQWTRTRESNLVRDRGDGKRGSGQGPDAKLAITHLRLLRQLPAGLSLVEARLETGRTHQIRIHLSESGHPVAGDRLYGDPATARRAPRLALHAYFLAFEDSDGAAHEFQTPLPDDLDPLTR